jgi:hypothetical protein
MAEDPQNITTTKQETVSVTTGAANDNAPITRGDLRKWTSHWAAKVVATVTILGTVGGGGLALFKGWSMNHDAIVTNAYRIGLLEGSNTGIPDRVVALEAKQVDDRKRILDNTVIIQDGKAERIKMYAQFANTDATQAKILERQTSLFDKNQQDHDVLIKNQANNFELLIQKMSEGDKALLAEINQLKQEVAELRGVVKGAIDKLKGLAAVTPTPTGPMPAQPGN